MTVRTERARLLGVLDTRIGIVDEGPPRPTSPRTPKRPKPHPEHYGVALPDNLYLETFFYPASTSKVDKAWEKSNGLRLAACLKALLGKRPFRWHGPDSAERMAEQVYGRAVPLEYDPAWEPDAIVIHSHGTEAEKEERPARARRAKAPKAPPVVQQGLFGDTK